MVGRCNLFLIVVSTYAEQEGSGTALLFGQKDAKTGTQLPDFINFAEKNMPRVFISPRLESINNSRMECRLQGLLSPEVAKVWTQKKRQCITTPFIGFPGACTQRCTWC